MNSNEKPRRLATGEASEASLLSGFDKFENSRKTKRYQAHFVARRARVAPALARAIAALAFPEREAPR